MAPPPPSRDARLQSQLDGVCRRMSHELHELSQLVSPAAARESPEFGRLSRILQRVQQLEGEASQALAEAGGLPSDASPALRVAVAQYAELLRQTVQHIGTLETRLTEERARLTPRLDAAARGRQVLAAYARHSDTL